VIQFNRRLGSGSYKTVYLAFDNDTGREVAWNVITFSHLNRSERKRIDAEIQIIKSLDHPRILKFISVWINREKEEVVFITERVSGGSLRAYICRLDGPLKLKVIKNWCRQILEGISYLHAQPDPVIHRDLKCDNIFINGNDGKVLIGDLGLSTSLRGQASCATSIVGTPEFMAPELYEEKYGPPVDIYAFGMCLLEMVSRQYPYSECTTPGQIYKKVISSEKPSVLARVKDPALRHLIEVCLDTNPDNRPTADDLLTDPYWQQMEDGLADIAEEEERPETPTRPTGPGYCDSGALASDNSCDGPAPVKKPLPKSGVYHEEAERRKAAAAAAAAAVSGQIQPISESVNPAEISLPTLAPNVLPGPGDDTLILLSSPKSGRDNQDLEKSDVLTYCRRKGIERVEKVHLILELSEGKYHNVIFDFNALTDHPQIISQELRDAGLVWEGVSNEELVRLTAQSIMDRISELQQVNTSTLSSVGSTNSAVDLLSGGEVGPSIVMTSDVVFGPPDARLSPPAEPPVGRLPPPPLTLQGKPPLPPPSQSPPSRSSLDSLDGAPPVIINATKRNSSYQTIDSMLVNVPGDDVHQYLVLSRETCSHLTVPLVGPIGPGGEYPQPINRLSFDSVMPGMEVPIVTPPMRSASVGHSLDEMGHSQFSLNNWPSPVAPLNTDRPVTGEDVRQLQAMLAVTTGDRRHTSFVPGVYCAFTEDCVRDFQMNNGLDVTGEVDDRTWELVSEQVAYRRKKEEERAHRREEAQRKAKMEMEKKLQQQKEESARAMDNIMEKTLNSIAKGPAGSSLSVSKNQPLGGVSPGLTAASSPVPPPTSPTTVTATLLQEHNFS
jgi:serine/threonine protein kinase/peptidoglycan hydrolase-like protein with peptidoglycan-binding domain